MSSKLSLLGVLLLTVTGCTVWSTSSPTNTVVSDPIATFNAQVNELGANLELQTELNTLFDTTVASGFFYPMEQYSTTRTRKVFGQYIAPDSGDRFSGYHTGDDVEVTDVSATVPVVALTTATVVQKQTVSGYGGVVILEFTDSGTTYHALYGHLNLDSVSVPVGDTITAGAQLGVLGDDASAQTDGERKHLHFGLYPFTGTELYAGYVANDIDLVNWVNPADWLRDHVVAD